ncbi:MAG: hypothetical protein K0R85_1685, partial [Devosia sp.]|nr:hypothetical protein [Devosia sp.]
MPAPLAPPIFQQQTFSGLERRVPKAPVSALQPHPEDQLSRLSSASRSRRNSGFLPGDGLVDRTGEGGRWAFAAEQSHADRFGGALLDRFVA